MVSYCTVLSACSKHVQIAHAVSYIIDIPSAEACGHRSPLYNSKENSMCVQHGNLCNTIWNSYIDNSMIG